MVFRLLVAAIFFMHGSLSEGQTINLDPANYTEIKFDDIPATSYKLQDGGLNITVKKSSSALVMPFDGVKRVSQIKFEWQMEGTVKTKNASHEKTKSGDDFPLRIGLCLQGNAPSVPFFAPAWIKKISAIMKIPSDKLIYFVVGSKHKAGEAWESPYTSSMELRALTGETANDWQVIDHQIADALNVVGLWLMSDGDNTDSDFKITLRSLILQ